MGLFMSVSGISISSFYSTLFDCCCIFVCTLFLTLVCHCFSVAKPKNYLIVSGLINLGNLNAFLIWFEYTPSSTFYWFSE